MLVLYQSILFTMSYKNRRFASNLGTDISNIKTITICTFKATGERKNINDGYIMFRKLQNQ